MRCDCYLCKRHARIHAVLKGRNRRKMRELIVELANNLCASELDNDVHEAIMDGSWPSAREQLTRALALCPIAEERPLQAVAGKEK
jgi:hypothetical protein